MKKWAIQVATVRPKTIYAVVVILVLLLGALIARIQIDTDPENMLPPDQADRQSSTACFLSLTTFTVLPMADRLPRAFTMTSATSARHKAPGPRTSAPG